MFMRLALPLSRLHYITRAEPRQAGGSLASMTWLTSAQLTIAW